MVYVTFNVIPLFNSPLTLPDQSKRHGQQICLRFSAKRWRTMPPSLLARADEVIE